MIELNSRINYPGGIGFIIGHRTIHNRADNSNKLVYLIKHARFFKQNEVGVTQEIEEKFVTKTT